MMKTIYICSRLKNRSLNQRITNFLESSGFKVHLPGRDTPQHNRDVIFTGNLIAIQKCDTFLAILKGGGLDFAFEVGYAFGLGKPILGFTEDDSYEDSLMLAGALSKTFKSFNELEKEISKI